MSSRPLYEKLDDHQKVAVEFAWQQPLAAILAEQGTGKTYIAAGIIERLDLEVDGLLIVPLTNIETTWVKALTSNFPQLSVCRTLDEYRAASKPRVLVMHFEAVPGDVKRLRRTRWGVIIIDEAQRLKDRASLTSRTAAKLKDSAPRKLILTGTPIESRPQDLWAQLRFLAPAVLGTRWADFEDEFLEPVNIDLSQYRPGSLRYAQMARALLIRKRKRKFLAEKMPRFLELIAPHCLRIGKDVLNLPPPRVHRVAVTMRGRQRRIYDRLENDLVATVRGSTVTASLRVTQIGKLHQVCGGYLIDDDGEAHEVGDAKLVELRRIIRRRPFKRRGPFVVFCRYLEEVDSIHDEFVREFDRVETLTGADKKRRNEIVEAFQAGDIDLLICQIRTGGVGIDLFRARCVVMYSTTYSHIDFEQAMARVHRRGQRHIIDVFLLVATNSIDEDIYQALLDKHQVADLVLSRLKHRRNDDMPEEKNDKAEAAPKYGVKELATEMNLQPATVRVLLRQHKVAKAGKSYGWNTKTDMQAVATKLKASNDGKDKGEAKPAAKKAAAKKPAAKKATPKKAAA